jgi:S-adenosylmethionine synthetase
MITVRREPGPGSAPAEIVERKGLGHPGTLADALAERLSVAYSRYCPQ